MPHAVNGPRQIFRMLLFIAKGVCVYGHGSAIPGHGEAFFWDKPVFERRQDGGQIKNVLEDALEIVRKRLSIEDAFYHVLCDILFGFRFHQFPVRVSKQETEIPLFPAFP